MTRQIPTDGPTSPNPTSGYIEIVPLEDVVQTDWTVEKAMSFVMTGGANAPDRVLYQTAAATKVGAGRTASGDGRLGRVVRRPARFDDAAGSASAWHLLTHPHEFFLPPRQ